MNLKYGVNTIKKLSTLSKSLLIALSVLGIGTLAVASGQIPAISGAKTSDAVAIAQSKISLEQAVAIAQKTVEGDLISAEFDQNDYIEGGEYEIELIDSGMEHKVKVDASSGKVLKSKQGKMDQDDLAEYNAMRQAQKTLTQAMQKATQSVGGKITEAEFDFDNGIPAYEIEIAKGMDIHKLIIDSTNGQVISSQLDDDD
ncbi:PepSY domain-containing protein [Psychrobacter sp. N25K4-3-2]|uniref:PepSY domain-containing protein n=1 Tax=Psychrobacter sp. N25K4-3-2 TaxID=2785026 RepID=UPI00188CBA20|nr:PepSY domain-containing protein [Psychrobacter sp. N25K4-3-2]MBF4490777.1 PepSY domain-containing protein [Psychrobacter sp. N25K4-3-2]